MPKVIDIRQVPAYLRKRQADYSRAGVITLQKAAAIAITMLIEETPVDTGRARSNWVVTLNGTFSGLLPAYFPGKKLGREENANKNAALGVALATINSFTPAMAKRGGYINISNNLWYIPDLNAGKSDQTTPFFIERAMQLAQLSMTPFGGGKRIGGLTFTRTSGGSFRSLNASGSASAFRQTTRARSGGRTRSLASSGR